MALFLAQLASPSVAFPAELVSELWSEDIAKDKIDIIDEREVKVPMATFILNIGCMWEVCDAWQDNSRAEKGRTVLHE